MLFPFTIDSLVYITTAIQLASFKGLICTNFFVDQTAGNWIQTFLQPPGYPGLIALFQIFGIDAYSMSLVLPRAMFVLLPVLFYLIFKRFMPQRLARIGALLSTFMLATIKSSLMAWSDTPYLCFSLFSILAAFHMIEEEGKISLKWAALAGIILGYSFLIRLIGITLMASIGVGFGAALFLRIFSLKDFLRIVAVYALSVGLMVAPYFIRNIFVFGTWQTFQTAPSNTSWMTNLLDFSGAISKQFLAYESPFTGVAIIMMSLGILIAIQARGLYKTNKKAFVCLIILISYFLLNSSQLIMLRSMFLSPGKIEDRYLIQISWIIVMALFLQKSWGKLFKGFLAVIILVMLMAQAFLARDFLNEQARLVQISGQVEKYAKVLQSFPEDVVIVSNFSDVMYYHLRRNVRMLANYTPELLKQALSSKVRFVVVVLKAGQNPQGDWGWYSALWGNPTGYEKIFSNQDIDIFFPLK